MKQLDNKQIDGLQRLLSLLDPKSLTREEFTDQFKKILEFLKRLKAKNQSEITSLNKSISDLSAKLKDDNTTDLSGQKNEFTNIINKALKSQEDGMNFIRDKVRQVKNGIDGKSADETKIVKAVLAQIKLPEYKETVLDNAGQIADKLELLKDDSRLKIDAVKGLKEELDELKQRPLGGKGGGFSKIHLEMKMIDDETPSGAVNGSNTDFTLVKTPNPTTSLKVFINGMRMRITEDYTLSGKTITFLTAPLTTSIILCDYRI